MIIKKQVKPIRELVKTKELGKHFQTDYSCQVEINKS